MVLGLWVMGAGRNGGWEQRAGACPACLGPTAPPLSLAQRVVNCELALRAAPTAAPRQFRVLGAFKGEVPAGDLVELAPADAPPIPPRGDRESLLGYETLARRWVFLGEIAPGNAEWLAHLAPLRRTADLTPAEWLQRAEFFLANLGTDEVLRDETAFRELVRTPYATMRQLRPRLDERSLFQALDPERLPQRRALAALLLGIADTAGARDYIARELAPVLQAEATSQPPATAPGSPAKASEPPTATKLGGQPASDRGSTLRKPGERPDLAALLTAHLERHGADALPVLTQRLLLSAQATRNERQAFLLACSIHGTADGAVSRDEVAAFFQELLANPEDVTRSLAPTLVADLQAWSRWGAVPQVTRLRDVTTPDDPARAVYEQYLELARKAADGL